MMNRFLKNLGKKTSDEIIPTQPEVDAAELQLQQDLIDGERCLTDAGAIFNSLNETIVKSDPSLLHKLQKSDAKQLTEKRQKDVVSLKFPKMKMHLSNLSALLCAANHEQVGYRAQIRHYIHTPEKLAESRVNYRLMLKEFAIKSSPIIVLIGEVKILFSDHIQNVSVGIDIEQVKKEVSEQVKEGADFCQDVELKQLAMRVEQVAEQQEILLKEKKDLFANILNDGKHEDAQTTMHAIHEKNETHSKAILEKTRLLDALHKQVCVRVSNLREREEATTDFMSAIYQNFLTVSNAYGLEILRFNGGSFHDSLNDEANKILSEIAKKIREDYDLLKLNKANVVDGNRALRASNNLANATLEEIKAAKNAHIAPYRDNFKKMNKLYQLRIFRIHDALDGELKPLIEDTDLACSDDVKKIIDDLDKMALSNRHSLPTMEHWTQLAAAELEIEKIAFVYKSYKFFNTILAWQADVLTHANNKSYVNKYIELKNRVNNALPSPDEWTKSTNRKQLLAAAKAKMSAIEYEFEVTMAEDKQLIEERRAEREVNSRPIQVFCQKLVEQIKLLQADPNSPERDARIVLLATIKSRFVKHRHHYLEKVLGGPDQQAQHVLFCANAEKILMNELIEKKGLEKITDLVLRSKFKSLVRGLFEPVHQMICKAKNIKYSPRLFATLHEKELARSAQDLSKGIKQFSDLGTERRWKGITRSATRFVSA